MAAGGSAGLAGHAALADVLWAATTAVVVLPAIWWVVGALRRRQFGTDVIAVFALAGTLIVGEYLAGAVIALMFAGGRALEDRATGRARRDLAALASLAPRVAHRRTATGLATVDADEIQPGDPILVRPGEIVPVDGIAMSAAVLDQSMITGESLPAEIAPGGMVRSGTVNTAGPIELRTTSTAASSTYAGLVRLARDAAAETAPFVRMADRYAAFFLPIVLAVAFGAWAWSGDAVRSVAVLVVATPCPLILAAPIAYVSGMSRCARRGVIVKGGAALDALAQVRTLLFDKTGTVTAGRPSVTRVISPGSVSGDEVLRLAASVDQVSSHVLATAIVAAADKRGLRLQLPQQVEEVPGAGIRGLVGTREVTVGKARLPSSDAPSWVTGTRQLAASDGLSTVFVGVNGELAGAVILHDPLRLDAMRTFRLLRRAGIERAVMITGDKPAVATPIGALVGADEVQADATPARKVDVVRRETRSGPTVMVGDGVNDAPALAAATVGVALGARGASASSEAADVVITVHRLDRVAETLLIAQRTRHIARQSALAGMGLSLIAMVVAALGWLPPVGGALVQEAIDVAVILNALRALGAGYGLRRQPALSGDAAELVRRLDEDHRKLWPRIDLLPVTARELASLPRLERLVRLDAVTDLLTNEVLPHERDDENLLYPRVARALGGTDPTATMSRGHAEIAALAQRIEAHVDRLRDSTHPSGDAEAVEQLQGLLYELYAVLRLHLAQEDENYHSLAATPRQDRPTEN